MATAATSSPAHSDTAHRDGAISDFVLTSLGSLKWTVWLFAASIVIIMAGTMAQDEMNMQQVKDAYFTCWLSRVYIDDFVPQSFHFHETRIGASEVFPHGFWFPFPGGKLIGFALLINLIAAKITRFHIRAKGTRLTAGIVFCAIGLGILGYVVETGSSEEGLQGQPPSYPMVWHGLQALVVVSLLGSIAGIFRAQRKGWRWIFGLMATVFAIGVGALVMGFTIGEPGLRIVWQLAKGLGIASILLIGCLLLFGRQGGNLLLHFGVALLMIGQFAFGDKQLEQRLMLAEREASNTLANHDEIELAFIDRSTEGEDRVISIPDSMLASYAGSTDRIVDERLPFEVQVLKYMPNSRPDEGSENLATKGMGLEMPFVDKPPVGGADSEINVASAYVKLFTSDSSKSIGTYLVTQYVNDLKMLNGGKDKLEEIESGSQTFHMGLRYQRIAKPYWVKLSKVQRINYSGTETPRDYSSFVRIIDPTTGEERTERIWMNNPLRYQGETFYQSSYIEKSGRKSTVLQVVRNQGWLIPYIACGIVGLGMMVHFIGTLDRFVSRRERESKKAAEETESAAAGSTSSWPIWSVVGVLGLMQVYMLVPWSQVSQSPESRMKKLDMYAAGAIPVMYGGRVMPLDQFTRQTLKVVSNKDSLPTDKAPKALADRVGKKLSGLEWFFETISEQDEILDMPMFRIDAAEVLSEVGLTVRPEKRYTFNQLEPSFERIEEIAKAARAKDERSLTFKEAATLLLYKRLNQFLMVRETFRTPTDPSEIPRSMIPEDMTEEDVIAAVLRIDTQHAAGVARMGGPAIIPPFGDIPEIAGQNPPWKYYFPAAIEAKAAELDQESYDAPGFEAFTKMIEAYGEQDTVEFNTAADEMLTQVDASAPVELTPWRVRLERWVVAQNPRVAIFIVYIVALLFGLACLLVKLPRLQKATFCVLCLTFVVHTGFIICRMLITGRAPVINLYSSAVFIAWAAVFAGIIFETFFRHGIGNVVAAMSGVFGLLVAHGLDTGDTMPVLQAVLDTQFWLGTHVVTISAGYSATFLAGILGILYLISSPMLSQRLAEKRRDLYRMIYGACCFGILFSFIGTVLGGLWADDSWGRFWGWDPKENGALLIVIWNALMLHARWDGMVKERGFATLSIGGNIVTAWSWFGTNQLGFGLHSYGGQDSVKMLLLYFLASMLVMIGVGVVGSYIKFDDDKRKPSAS